MRTFCPLKRDYHSHRRELDIFGDNLILFGEIFLLFEEHIILLEERILVGQCYFLYSDIFFERLNKLRNNLAQISFR